jgi:anhydro-N-acetylmuramic acid kinase
MQTEYYIGIMSGTSLDGIDICIVQKENQTNNGKEKNYFSLVEFLCVAYPSEIKEDLNQFNLSQEANLSKLAYLEKRLAELYSQAVKQILEKAKMQANQITAIGCHGQTIFHQPTRFSIQLGHPAFIAKHTGITTVADFRIDDMANNGQGAPIAPAFHQFMFADKPAMAIVNIGGIANISIINTENIIGFDTGPGNGLMDEICQQHLNQGFDKNGEIAQKTPVNQPLLNKLLQDDYFTTPAPKSTGRDYFNLDWFKPKLTGNESITEQVSTLNQLTATSIAEAINQHKVSEVLICGGGAENTTLLARIAEQTKVPVATTKKYDINPHSLESFMCAWLAEQRLSKKPIKLHKITGAKKDSILGGIWEA